MKVTLLARSCYPSIALIVMIAISGCFAIPITKHEEGAKPGAIEVGKTSKAKIVDKFGGPDARTVDGRFFLYAYRKDTEWFWFFTTLPISAFDEGPPMTTHRNDRVLIEFDQNNIVKRNVVHKCGKKTADPKICTASLQNAMWVMIQELYGDELAAQYRQITMLADSLAEPLRQAAKRSDLEEIKRLIDQGANVNAIDRSGQPLLIGAIRTGDPAVVELLLAKGADVNGSTEYTALHWALLERHTTIAQILIANGADVKATDALGYTPLHWAADGGHIVIVETLLARGADSNVKALDGTTPLHEAAQQGDAAVVELLLANGARVSAKNKSGQTPLARAALNGQVAIVKELLVHGGSVNTKAKDGQTPLHLAAEQGHKGVAELLIAKGVDVNVKDKKGTTPLYVAVRGNHIAVVELLLAHGADVNAKPKHGNTPIQTATNLGRKEIVELLKQHGAKE